MAASRRFGTIGIGDELLSVRFDVRTLLRLATRTGQSFGPGFSEALASTNERVAIKIQEAMVQSLQTKINETGRTQRGTKHLEISLLDEHNREVNGSNFTVLRPSWMDRSPAAKYWRRIEEGDTQVYQGYVLFANGFTGSGGGLGVRGKAYGPYTPGGSRELGGLSRSESPGYKHSRLIFTRRGRGGWSDSIGPWPKYAYTSGGRRAMRNISMKAEYALALSRIGIRMSDVSRVK